MKFGGSSVGTADAIRQVASIVARFRDRKPVLVVSALQGVTDQLLSAARAAAAHSQEHRTTLAAIRERHVRIIDGLAPGAAETVMGLLSDLEKRVLEVDAAGVLEPWAQDEIVSFGERLSAPIVAAAIGGTSVDSRVCIRTDARFIGADVDFPHSNESIRQTILPLVASGEIPVVTGYIGQSPDGRTTTLGRGGSDYTVTVLGGALGAEEIWIWKEVDGLMTADPRVVPDASVLSEVSYEEAAEMSFYGAKILHPKTMMPAMRGGVPVRMRNTFHPDAEGTLIGHVSAPSPQGVKAVTAMRDLAMVAVVGDAMRGRPGIAGRLFSAMGEASVNILAIAQGSSERNITFVVRGEDADRAVRAAHKAFELEKISIKICEPSI